MSAAELDVASITEAIAARHPDRPCLVQGDLVRSWSEVADRTRRFAAVLLDAGLGARRVVENPWSSGQDHVALYLYNGPEYLESMLGAWKAGTAPFNVNYRYVADELHYLLEDSRAAAIVVHDAFAPTLAEVLPRLSSPPALILQVADGSDHELLPGAVDLETALAAADPDLPAEVVGAWSGDDLYLCYTGGTTGMPKGTMWRQGDFLVSALGVRRRDGDEYASIDEVVDDARGTVRALPAPPLMHGAAHWNALSCWIAGGAVVIQSVVDRFDAHDVLDTIERHGATSLLLVGDPMARPLVDVLVEERAAGHRRDLSRLRHVLSGGAVLSPALKSTLLELLPGVTIIDVLGSTESGRQGVARHGAGDDTTTGFAPSSTAVVLTEDLDGLLVAGSDEIGWLAQGGRVPLGYLGDPDKTAATFPRVDGVRYAVPGDRARLGADGRIELRGRDSVCINTGGEKVFAEEVETAVKSHPAVLDAVVCGRPSPRWGEEVVAVVQLRPGADVDDADLVAAAAEHIARYKLPRAIVRRDLVVRAPSGKADYRWARQQVTPSTPPRSE